MEKGPSPQAGDGTEKILESFGDLETLKTQLIIKSDDTDRSEADLSPLQPFANYGDAETKVTLGEVNIDTEKYQVSPTKTEVIKPGDDLTAKKIFASNDNTNQEVGVPSYVLDIPAVEVPSPAPEQAVEQKDEVTKEVPTSAYESKRKELLENSKSFRALEKDYQAQIDNFYQQGGLAGNFNKVRSFLGFRPQLPEAVQQKRDEYVKAKATYARLLNDSLQLRSGVERAREATELGADRAIDRPDSKFYDQESASTKAAFLQKFILKPNQELLAKQEVYLLTKEERDARDLLLKRFMSSKLKTPVLIGGGALLVASGGLSTLAALGAGFSVRRLTRGGVEKAEAGRDALKQDFSLDKLEEQESNLLSAEETLRVKKRNRKYLSAAAAAMAGGLTNNYGDTIADNLNPIGRAEASISPEQVFGRAPLDTPAYIDLSETGLATPSELATPDFSTDNFSTAEVSEEMFGPEINPDSPTVATNESVVGEGALESQPSLDTSSTKAHTLSYGEVKTSDAFETTYPLGEEIIPDVEVVPHEYTVTRGDRLWKIVEREYPEYLKDLDVSQRNSALDTLFKAVQSDPEALRAIGLQSGNVDLIYPGESLDLSPLGEKLRTVVQERFDISTDSLDVSQEASNAVTEATATPDNSPIGTEVTSPEVVTEPEPVRVVIPAKPAATDFVDTTEAGANPPIATENAPGADIPDGTPLAPGMGEEVNVNELARNLYTPAGDSPEVVPSLPEIQVPNHEELVNIFGSEEAYEARVKEIIAQIEDVQEKGFFTRLLSSGVTSYDQIAGTPIDDIAKIAAQSESEVAEALEGTGIKAGALQAWAKFIQDFAGSHSNTLKLQDLVAIYAVNLELAKTKESTSAVSENTEVEAVAATEAPAVATEVVPTADTETPSVAETTSPLTEEDKLNIENLTLLKAENIPTTEQLEAAFGNLGNLQQLIDGYTSQVEGLSQEELSQRLTDKRTVLQQIGERSINDLLALRGQSDEVLQSAIPNTPENMAALRAWLNVVEGMEVRGEVSLRDTLVSATYNIKLQEK